MEEHETQHVTASLYMEEPEYRNGIAWKNMNIEMSLRHHMEEPEYRNVITCKNMNTEMQLRLLAQRVTRFAHHFEISSELLNQSGCAAAGAAAARPGSYSGAYSKKPCNSNNAWYYI